MASATTASDPRLQAKSPLLPRAHLFVAMSCHRPLEAPSRHALEGLDAVYIGRGASRQAVRSASNELRHLALTLADRHVSTEHARLVRRDGAWAFEDLGSKNGSLVNGAPCRAATLEDGDCLQIGHTLLIFRAALPTPEHAAQDLVATARAPALSTLVPRLARDLDVLAVAAASAVPVVLVSETGTGKEMLARAIHSLSCRKGDFVAVNCGGLPAALLESILFGHKRGAFSGAVTDHAGLFRTAHAGTL
ncbi:MAG TPA: FHA domain-containing protein, partial [Polyangiaceae bacterium]|nr:FHA domain-containing protein [Polyangiaceae bacterium]